MKSRVTAKSVRISIPVSLRLTKKQWDDLMSKIDRLVGKAIAQSQKEDPA